MPLYNPSSGGVSDGGTLATGLTFPLAGMHILDTNATHDLIVSPGSNLTADRTLTVVTGDSNRSLTLSGDATIAGSNTGDQNAFVTISVSGQSDVVADSTSDTLTLIAGTNVTITTSAGGDSITINSTGGGGATVALDNLSSVAINAALVLGTSDAFALGSATKMWSDLFLASGSVVNFNNGDVTITHAANTMTFTGASGGWLFSEAVMPASNGGASLGGVSNNWSDLFLASGAVINIANGNAVITHSSGVFTVSTGDLRVTTAGSNAASVVTVGGTQTLTGKRNTLRIGTETSSATSTPTSDSVDQWNVTALAAADVIAAPTGTPTDGQKLVLRIKSDSTPRALSFNAIYRDGSDVAFPTTTQASKTMYLGFAWNQADTRWDLLAVTDGI